jgi:hypothetical protein
MASSRPSKAGDVGITIELRTEASSGAGSSDRTYWTRLGEVVPFLATLLAIVGPNTEVLFEFGQIHLRPVPMARFALDVDPDPAP